MPFLCGELSSWRFYACWEGKRIGIKSRLHAYKVEFAALRWWWCHRELKKFLFLAVSFHANFGEREYHTLLFKVQWLLRYAKMRLGWFNFCGKKELFNFWFRFKSGKLVVKFQTTLSLFFCKCQRNDTTRIVLWHCLYNYSQTTSSLVWKWEFIRVFACDTFNCPRD